MKKYSVLALCFLLSGSLTSAYALNLDKARLLFLSGDYSACINEGEKLLADSAHSQNIDELYCLLGLSYLKEGNYLRSSDIFEIILKEFKQSRFREEAYLGAGDAYFLKGDYGRAESYYRELLKQHSKTAFAPAAYYRISQCAFKQGNASTGEEYLCKVKNSFPLSLEIRENKDLACPIVYYTVQVGSFSSNQNATNLMQNLTRKGYPAYIEVVNTPDKVPYRVRVGKLHGRQDAVTLADKLSQEGYPTRIYP
jgi:tetratricopeptide (TPR) repeat protein